MILRELNSFCMILFILIGVFMLSRYVFLEPSMEEDKQRKFYIIIFILVFITYFLCGNTASQIASLFFGGLNIAMGRKKHRFQGFFLTIPLTGIIDGIFAPIIAVQFLPVKENIMYSIMLTMYLLVAILLLIFYFKGKNWRRWFKENMKDRRPLPGEHFVLCISGFLLLAFSITTGTKLSNISTYPPEVTTPFLTVVCFYMLTSFMLTVTLVFLIMQGNRRKFYHDKVADMQFNVIATMADIVENRDENTGGHIKRTAKYVEIIGKKLKKQNAFPEVLTDKYLADMIVAAPLHDIGKIHIPDAILNKPGRLTTEEFTIMKTHASAGRDVLLKAKKQLGTFNYLNVALDMAEYHHEWWNGKGYPNALSGEDIPLCARIMAVADVFDALTSKRCYKEAMPLDKAFGIIQEETGTHFDPVVAEAFLSARKDIEKELEHFSSEDEE